MVRTLGTLALTWMVGGQISALLCHLRGDDERAHFMTTATLVASAVALSAAVLMIDHKAEKREGD